MSDKSIAEVKPTEPIVPEVIAEVKPTTVAKVIAEVKPTTVAKVKEVTIKCKFASVRIGSEYFTPDHEGNITVPAELAKDAKAICGV